MVSQSLARFNWRAESAQGNEQWPFRYSGVSNSIAWTLSFNPALENPDGNKAEGKSLQH